MYDELLHSESLIGLFHLVGTADFLNFESLDAFILHYVEDKSEEEISYMVRNEELKSLLKIIKVFFIFFLFFNSDYVCLRTQLLYMFFFCVCSLLVFI